MKSSIESFVPASGSAQNKELLRDVRIDGVREAEAAGVIKHIRGDGRPGVQGRAQIARGQDVVRIQRRAIEPGNHHVGSVDASRATQLWMSGPDLDDTTRSAESAFEDGALAIDCASARNIDS